MPNRPIADASDPMVTEVVSRTRLGLRNSGVALIYYIAEMLLGLVSRWVFIRYVGAELLGLNATVTNMLEMLNLAEMGLSTAVSFSLYKPIAEGDTQAVREIVALQGALYRGIAIVVMVLSALLLPFFPMIFAKSGVALWCPFAVFGVMLYGSLLTYFFNYKQIALNASQLHYKVVRSYKSVTLLRSALQIAAMWLLPHPYIWWLVLQAVMSTVATISLSRQIHHTFPYLRHLPSIGAIADNIRYHQIMSKTRQLMFHKIGDYVLHQTSPIIIYAILSLTVVAAYGNYMLPATGLLLLVQAIFGGLTAGVGNVVATGDSGHQHRLFGELFTSRFLISATCCFTLFISIDPFITLWVGSEYLLPRGAVAAIVGILFIQMFRSTVDDFIVGHGLFGDIWAPIIEAALNIGLSVALGLLYGITGIVCGVLVSLVLVIGIWKPYYLYTRGFKTAVRPYISLFAIHAAVTVVVTALLLWVVPRALPVPANFFVWGLETVAVMIAFAIIEWLLLWMLVPSMRAFTQRLRSHLRL